MCRKDWERTAFLSDLRCFPDILLKALRTVVKTLRIYMFSGQGPEYWTSRKEDSSVTIMSMVFDTYNKQTNKQTNKLSGFLVCERTIPTERPPLVSEVSANYCG
jgi:hypothetical protein